jgi:hypothetical protein
MHGAADKQKKKKNRSMKARAAAPPILSFLFACSPVRGSVACSIGVGRDANTCCGTRAAKAAGLVDAVAVAAFP